jgi:hypothetical protein
MAELSTLEERVSKLEQEISRLKAQINSSRRDPDWPWNISGSMKDFPNLRKSFG